MKCWDCQWVGGRRERKVQDWSAPSVRLAEDCRSAGEVAAIASRSRRPKPLFRRRNGCRRPADLQSWGATPTEKQFWQVYLNAMQCCNVAWRLLFFLIIPFPPTFSFARFFLYLIDMWCNSLIDLIYLNWLSGWDCCRSISHQTTWPTDQASSIKCEI